MSHAPVRLFTVVTLADGESWIDAHHRAVTQLIEQAQERGAAGVADIAIAQIADRTLVLTADISTQPG